MQKKDNPKEFGLFKDLNSPADCLFPLHFISDFLNEQIKFFQAHTRFSFLELFKREQTGIASYI